MSLSNSFKTIISRLSSHNRILLLTFIFGAILRFYQLGDYPTGIAKDEIDIGYNAYSFFLTGKDYQGNFFPVHFQSLGDYRPFLYMLTTAPFVGLLGLSSLTLRLPFAIISLVTIVLCYKLSKHLFDSQIALISTTIITFIPWHIHASRIAFEWNLMLLTSLLGTYFALKSLTKPTFIYAAAVSFGLGLYSYNIAKLFIPLNILIIIILYYKKLLSQKRKHLVISIVIFVILSIPLAASTFSGPGNTRFNSISIFQSEQIASQVTYNRLQTSNPYSVLTKILHNKYVYYLQSFITNYFQTFNLGFYFSQGDPNPRHSITNLGLFYTWLVIPFLVGLAKLYKKIFRPSYALITLWLLVSPIPTALTQHGQNHASRIYPIIIPITIIVALGINQIIKQFETNKLRTYLFLIILGSLSLIRFQYYYYIHEPATNFSWWDYQAKPLFNYTNQHQTSYDQIYIHPDVIDVPFLHYAFHTAYPPQRLHYLFQQSLTTPELSPPKQLDNLHFTLIKRNDFLRQTSTLYIVPGNIKETSLLRRYLIYQIPSPDPNDNQPLVNFYAKPPLSSQP